MSAEEGILRLDVELPARFLVQPFKSVEGCCEADAPTM